MQASNFNVDASIYLIVNGVTLDMHNCYDFCSYTHDVTNREVTLAWSKSKTHGKPLEPTDITIVFSSVDYLRVEPRDASIPFTEDDCLSGIGYDCDEAWADGMFWTDGPPEKNWRWCFEFQSSASINVRGQSVRATTKP